MCCRKKDMCMCVRSTQHALTCLCKQNEIHVGWPHICVCMREVLVPIVFGPCFCNRFLAVKICLPNSCCLCGRIPRSYLAQEQMRANGESGETPMCARAAAVESQDRDGQPRLSRRNLCAPKDMCVCVRAKQVLVPIVFSPCFCNHFFAAKKRLPNT